MIYHPSRKLDEYERQIIVEALEYHDRNKTNTAKALGIGLRTLRNKLHKYGLKEYMGAFRPRSREGEEGGEP